MSRLAGRIRNKLREYLKVSITVDNLVPPPAGTVYVSKNGCIVMSMKTFEEIKSRGTRQNE